MAKRTRRARRLEFDKPTQSVTDRFPADDAATLNPALAQAEMTNGTQVNGTLNQTVSRMVDFAREYYYVYRELSHILLVTLLMFVVMIILAFVI